jgi:hypothetical protein
VGGLIRYQGSVCRLVETQEFAATTSLVDDLEEQAILEKILDAYKPNYAKSSQDRHYLISTPFRYPPLAHGSRFGHLHQPSFFYASESVNTCLAEAAFYRFFLISATQVPYPKVIQSQHCLFFVRVLGKKCLDLCQLSDNPVEDKVSDPLSHSFSQQLGQSARQLSVDIIRYYSARSQDPGVNVAIDNHTVIQSKSPENMLETICQLDPNLGILRFSQPRSFPISFSREQFLVDGVFPTLN